MSAIILKIDNISKQYRLGLVGTGTLSDDLKRWWFRILKKPDPFLKVGTINDRSKKSDSNYIWALKNINIEVEEGEVLGIIGKNGAGKSTLLKILSRITMPTTGVVKSKGRIASLLEVGTGFHPELTGKENIYLNGAILGMTKAEIKEKETAIIEFSGCQNYIDTPVKRYSSGMRVRLAFAVAAFLEPDILVIDEVLAVGDAEFQKKAIGKMQDISRGEGRTVLFVSHNMASVKALCTRAIVLEHGEMVFEGGTDEAVSFYLKGGADLINHRQFGNTINKEVFQLHHISIKNTTRAIEDAIVEDEAIELKTALSFKASNPEDYHITYHLFNEMGEAMFSFSNTSEPLQKGNNVLCCYLPKGFLQSGQYFLSFFFVKDRRKAIFIEKDIMSFVVADGKRDIGVYMGKEPGYIRPQFKWERLDD
ncbi:ABC transporter ATP-binding protein [Seonamhaeicola aphaedonensis]|uniref:Lipopolysaccharide transport system ATP-binding protein n=1 Tax=Seonamhaeicola aphaedonensis TaxID=1461338 RepID=A0A3D9HFW0_9FLAO|nr:polysaccharide ABC transporter ATP-binding protein [Seonamhaeicola aphaedonensis]RED48382.1 lipopolysaccharide transport system ATP-binding protein [Seonamhaeicola aphaedonensis]